MGAAMGVAELDQRFSVPGVLGFGKTASGLVFARVSGAAAAATVYLQGAHLAEWQSAGQAPVLFLSAKSEYVPGNAIRGGVPVIFPWFGPRQDGKPGPAHGFARSSLWELEDAAVVGAGVEQVVHLTFALTPNEMSRGLGFDHFRVTYRMAIGQQLGMELAVANDAGAGAPLVMEDALHSYFAVGDVERATLTGLGGTEYLDKRDGGRRKVQAGGAMSLTEITDRVYLDTVATCVIEDAEARRRIVVEKSGSHETVVWNPWANLAAKMADMEPEGWRRMLCVETANVGDGAVTLAPGETHTMRAEIWAEAIS